MSSRFPQSLPATWRSAAAIAAFVVYAALPQAAAAQNVVLLVNGEPITAYDIDQRSKFHTLVSHKTPPRQEVINELIDEKLKVQVGKRYQLEIGDKDVDTAYGEMAKGMRLNSDQLTKVLGQSGVGAETLKSRIRADIVWSQIVRGKFQQSLQVRDKDVQEAIQGKKPDGPANYEYSLRPILFVVPRGSAAAVVEGRTR